MSILQRGKLSPKEREIMYLSSPVLSSHGQNFTLGILGHTDRARPPASLLLPQGLWSQSSSLVPAMRVSLSGSACILGRKGLKSHGLPFRERVFFSLFRGGLREHSSLSLALSPKNLWVHGCQGDR